MLASSDYMGSMDRSLHFMRERLSVIQDTGVREHSGKAMHLALPWHLLGFGVTRD